MIGLDLEIQDWIWSFQDQTTTCSKNCTAKNIHQPYRQQEAKAMRRQEEQEAESEEKKVLEGEHLPPQSIQEFEKLGQHIKKQKKTHSHCVSPSLFLNTSVSL